MTGLTRSPDSRMAANDASRSLAGVTTKVPKQQAGTSAINRRPFVTEDSGRQGAGSACGMTAPTRMTLRKNLGTVPACFLHRFPAALRSQRVCNAALPATGLG